MRHDARLEIRLPAAKRRELDELAADTGLTSADLARIGIRWLLAHRKILLRMPIEAIHAARPGK
jgi:hypothetical protein